MNEEKNLTENDDLFYIPLFEDDDNIVMDNETVSAADTTENIGNNTTVIKNIEERHLTFGEFVEKCELFLYSRENYNLLKEACELQLMVRYIEIQQFMIDNPECIETCREIHIEGLLFESNAEYEILLLEEKFSEKND